MTVVQKYLSEAALRVMHEDDDLSALLDELAEVEAEEEMVNLTEADTGIANIIFVSPKARMRHGPRVKVAIDPPDSYSPYGKIAVVDFKGNLVAGDMPADLLRQVQKFVELNEAVLTEYWLYQISTRELLNRLRQI